MHVALVAIVEVYAAVSVVRKDEIQADPRCCTCWVTDPKKVQRSNIHLSASNPAATSRSEASVSDSSFSSVAVLSSSAAHISSCFCCQLGVAWPSSPLTWAPGESGIEKPSWNDGPVLAMNAIAVLAVVAVVVLTVVASQVHNTAAPERIQFHNFNFKKKNTIYSTRIYAKVFSIASILVDHIPIAYSTAAATV